jgi:hypothetical protein
MIFNIPRNDPLQQSATGYRLQADGEAGPRRRQPQGGADGRGAAKISTARMAAARLGRYAPRSPNRAFADGRGVVCAPRDRTPCNCLRLQGMPASQDAVAGRRGGAGGPTLTRAAARRDLGPLFAAQARGAGEVYGVRRATLPHATVCHQYGAAVSMDHDSGTGPGRMAGSGPGNHGEGGTAPARVSRNSDTTPCNCLPSVAAGGRMVCDGGTGWGRMAGSGPDHHGEGGMAPARVSRNPDTTPCNCLPSVPAGARMVRDGGTGRGRLAGWGTGNHGEGRTAPARVSRNPDTTPYNCLPPATARR